MESIWPGRFFWDDLGTTWEEAPGDWTDAADTEVTDEQASAALEVLGLRQGYNAEALQKCYRKKALACHPDKTGDTTDAFDVLCTIIIITVTSVANPIQPRRATKSHLT